jgi:hypothetical protein
MEMMCKIHKQDEFNSNQRITSDAMLHKGLEGFDYHRSMVGMRVFFLIFSQFYSSNQYTRSYYRKESAASPRLPSHKHVKLP